MSERFYTYNQTIMMRTSLLPVAFPTQWPIDDCRMEIAQAAIAVASPSLYLSRERDIESSRAQSKMYRYLKRMSSRSTPYGLFAGVSTLKFCDHTDICFENSFLTKTRPDMSWLAELVKKCESDQRIREELTYWPNPELFTKSGRLWLERGSQLRLQNKAVNVQATPPVMRVLNLCSAGMQYKLLLKTICTEFAVSIERSRKLCDQLCDLSLLISDLRFPLTVAEPLPYVIEKIEKILPANSIVLNLRRLANALASWDACSTKSADDYLSILRLMSAAEREKNQSELLQVDMATKLQTSRISSLVADKMVEAGELLLCMSTATHSPLKHYKQLFEQNYQLGREVPLLELVDSTFGIGLPSTTSNSYKSNRWKRDQVLFDLAAQAFRDCVQSIELDSDTLRILRNPLSVDQLPLSIDIFFKVIARSQSGIDSGHFEILVAPRLGDLGGGRALGRFAHLLGDHATSALKETCELETKCLRSSEISVDVTFWPDQSRTGNVAQAPSLRGYQIVAGCVPSHNSVTVSLTDIVIGLSENKFYARWLKTGQKILARSSNLLNRQGTPPVIQFLLDIADDNVTALSHFDWGPAENFLALPRVTVNRIILSPARWSLRQLSNSESDKCAISFNFAKRVLEWRDRFRVPELVLISAGRADDRCLLLDISNERDIKLLQDMLDEPNGSSLVATEYIPDGDWHINSEVNPISEFVGTLIRKESMVSKTSPAKTPTLPCVNRSTYLQTPGSDWVYLRLVCARNLHDELVVQAQRLAEKLFETQGLRKWFFLRFVQSSADELRLRFQCIESSSAWRTMQALAQWSKHLTLDGMVKHYSFDTYDREVERYGGVDAMPAVEDLFAQDSTFVASLLSDRTVLQLNRLIVGVISTNTLLKTFFPSVEERLKWLKQSVSLDWKRTYSAEFRKEKPILKSLLLGEAADGYHPLIQLCDDSLAYISPVSQALQSMENEARVQQTISHLCQSFVHLHCNRLVGIKPEDEQRIRTYLCNALESIVKTGSIKQENHQVLELDLAY